MKFCCVLFDWQGRCGAGTYGTVTGQTSQVTACTACLLSTSTSVCHVVLFADLPSFLCF
jgi:hypothetical protein